jgi:hypothetical protein
MFVIIVTSMNKTIPSQEVSDIGWLAGIIDGEGSLAHYYSKRKGQSKLGVPYKESPIFGVYIINTDMEIMRHAKSIYNELGLFAQINLKSASRKQREGSFYGTKPCYELVVRRRRDVEELLRLVTPYLRGYKRAKAQAMLDFFLTKPFYSR